MLFYSTDVILCYKYNDKLKVAALENEYICIDIQSTRAVWTVADILKKKYIFFKLGPFWFFVLQNI